MGYVEIEEFDLIAGVDRAEFAARDRAVQLWSYRHRPNLVRRTTALGDGARVLVVTLFSGSTTPEAPPLAVAEVAALAELADPASYRRACFRDLE